MKMKERKKERKRKKRTAGNVNKGLSGMKKHLKENYLKYFRHFSYYLNPWSAPFNCL